MGTIPAPNIADAGGEIVSSSLQVPNALAEYTRVAGLKQQQQQQAQSFPLEQQQRQQQIEMQRRQMADQDALTKAITAYDPAKHTLADIPKLVTQNGGSGQAALQAQTGLITQRQNLSKLTDEQFAQEQKKADLIQGVHDTVSQAPAEQKQNAYTQGLQQLSRAGVDVSKESPQYPGDDVFAQHLAPIRLHSAIIAEAEKDREQTTKEQTAQAGDWKEGGGGTLVNVNPKSPQFGKIMHGAGNVDQQEMNSYLTAPKIPNESLPPEQRNPATFLAWKAKQSPLAQINVANAAGGGMEQGAVDQAAEYYHLTGKLPPGGRGVAGLAQNRKIMNRASELYPGSMAEGTAEYAANKNSLQGIQKQFDQVSAFENTAGKNLDVFLNQAKKVVDSGSPWINKPLRSVASGALGSEDQAAFNAARQTAVTEIAKVLSSANAGSGVLSDSARQEVEGLIGPNASLKQIVSAANVLKKDMANRHQSYQDQIADIQGRIGGKKAAPPAGATPSQPKDDFFSQFGGKSRQ